MIQKKVIKVFWIFIPLVLIAFIFFVIRKPSNNRDWEVDQSILPEVEIENNLVHIKNIRDFDYKTETNYIKNYYDRTFDLDKIKSIDFGLSIFSKWKGLAHTFLSFGFEDGEYVAVSIEIRKEKNETYSALRGLLNEYEIMYVVADEGDVIKLRTNIRDEKVYLYPVKTTKEKQQELFLNIMEQVKRLEIEPEFYNTATNACGTGIMSHVNEISERRIPIDFRVLIPGYSDELGYKLGLFDTELSLEEAQKKFYISDKAKKFVKGQNFSRMIRE